MGNNETIGAKIARLRKSNGYTQADVGAYLNISSQAVSKWERGESCPDFSTMSRLAQYFGVPITYFEEGGGNVSETNETKPVLAEEKEETTVCPFCGKTTPLKGGFCAHCEGYFGKKSDEAKSIGGVTQKKASVKEKICTACGKPMPKSVIYCPHCHNMVGTRAAPPKQTVYTRAPSDKQTMGQTNAWAIAALVCSIVGFLGLGLIFGYIGLKKSNETGTGAGMSMFSIIFNWICIVIVLVCAILIGLVTASY